MLLALLVGLFVWTGDSIVDLVGRNPPPADGFDIRRVEFQPGEIRVLVRNPQEQRLTIASVTVDDAIVPCSLDGPRTLKRLVRARLIPYDWVPDGAISVGVTSSTGIETTEEVPAAVETPQPSPRGPGLQDHRPPRRRGAGRPRPTLAAFAPACRRALARGVHGAYRGPSLLPRRGSALESICRASGATGPIGGAGLVLLGVASSYLLMTFLARRLGGSTGATGLALAALVAIGIGAHNLGEGLAIGASFAIGELTLGSFLIVRFMIHNITERAPESRLPPPSRSGRRSPSSPTALALVAGEACDHGAWIGGYASTDVLTVLFFAGAAGAALSRSWWKWAGTWPGALRAVSRRAGRSAASWPASPRCTSRACSQARPSVS